MQNFSQTSVTTQTKTGLGFMFDPLGIGPDLENKTVTDARATSTAIGTKLVSTQKIEIGVGNKTELRGAEVEAPQIAFVKTDPSKAGELILGGSTNTTQTSHTEKTETAGVYQEMKGNGSTVETLNQTILKGNVAFDSALKITVQIPDTKGGQALKSQIHALVEQSNGVGLEYLNALANNPNVKWDQVALAHEKWSYDQGGLTGAGAALLTIVVTYFTAGMGTAAVGGTAATATSAATVMGSTTLATAVNAGFSALASQAAVAMVNNKGDIGKTLDQLGKEESIKGLLTTMVTAGALDKLNASYFKGVDAKSSFFDQLQKNVTNNLATDMVNSALAGKPFDEKTLANSLTNGLITTGMAIGAKGIGDAKDIETLNAFTHKVAHAALGCVGGAAMAGNGSGCAPGAAGAVVGELAAEYYIENRLDASKTFDENIQSAKEFAKVLSATAGVIAGGGGDNAAAVNIAATTGANAVSNNYFSRSPFPKVRTAVAKENARLTTACGTNCTQEDFIRIDQQAAKLERALNLVEVAQRGRLNQSDAVSLTQLVMEIAPGTGTLESLAQLITGKQTLTGEETSRLWAAIGVIPFGGVLKPLGRTVGDLTTVLSKDADIIAKKVGNGANGGTAIPSGFKPFNVEGLPAGSTGVVDVASGEVRVLNAAGKVVDIPPTSIPTGVNATVVPQTTTGIKWGGGIAEQGLPFETYLAETTMPAGSRLPTNFKTFDFFDRETGIATSAKTLDTMTAAKVTDPTQVFTSLRGNVDTVAGFNGVARLSGTTVDSASITARELQVAVPAGTTPAQWAQINKAIEYGQSQGVTVKVTVVKP